MRVQVYDCDDFLEELREEAANVRGLTVRVRIDRIPEQAEAVSHEVDVWATCVVMSAEEGPYLLEFCAKAGRDTQGNGAIGSKVAESWRSKIADVCGSCGLRLRRGKLEVI